MLSPLLAFEFFDDVAAYWFILTILGFIVVPRSLYIGVSWLWAILFTKKAKKSSTASSSSSHVVVHTIGDAACQCSLCSDKAASVQEYHAEKQWKQWFSFWNIMWLLTLCVFLFMLTDYTSRGEQQLSSFDPYELLGLDASTSPSMAAIKKAYRKQSLVYHPDKNPDNEDAHLKFILIAKAYQTLTDESTRENYERYGNPDGYQGTSVTIGLPSFLSRQENARVVLGVYLMFIVAIPVVVGIWWSRVSKYHPSGVLNESIGLYYSEIKENMPHRKLLEVMSASTEFRDMFPTGGGRALTRTDIECLQKLDPLIKNELSLTKSFVQSLTYNLAYAAKTNALLHAYLLPGIEVPAEWQPDLRKVLQKIHHLLEAACLAAASPHVVGNKYVWHLEPVLRLIQLAQLITQKVDFRAIDRSGVELYQLPHLSPAVVAKSRLKPKPTVRSFVEASDSDKDKQYLLKGLDEQQVAEVERVARLLPKVDVDITCEVEAENDGKFYPSDYVTMKITLLRRTNGEIADAAAAAAVETDKNGGSVSTNGDDSSTTKTSTATTGVVAEKEDNPLELEWNTPEKVARSNELAPVAHAPAFPFPKREVWHIIVWDAVDEKILFMEAVNNLHTSMETREVKFFVSESGATVTRKYDVYVMCDAYLGVDEKIEYKMHVEKEERKSHLLDDSDEEEYDGDAGDEDDEIRKRRRRRRKKRGVDDGEDGEDEEEDEEEGGGNEKWYYLYQESFGEMVLLLAVLALLGIFVFNYLYSRGWFHTFGGWWQSYGGPVRHVYEKVEGYVPDWLSWRRLYAQWSWLFEKKTDIVHQKPDL